MAAGCKNCCWVEGQCSRLCLPVHHVWVQICNHLAREVGLLQAQAQPALEDLTRHADQETLERVRRIKTGHQRLITRVGLVREVLEKHMEVRFSTMAVPSLLSRMFRLFRQFQLF